MDRFAFFHELVQFLATVGFPAPRLVENNAGRTYHPLGKFVFELWHWVDGVNCRDKPWHVQELDIMARLLARFHQTTEAFEPTVPYEEPPIEREIAGRLEKLAHRPVPAFILACAEYIANFADRFAKLPKTTIHGDVWKANFLRDSQRWWLIDYEWSRIDARLWDLGDGLKSIPALDHRVVSISTFEKMLGTYLIEGSLTDLEFECLPVMMQAIALRSPIGILEQVDAQLPDRQWTEQVEERLQNDHTTLCKSIIEQEQALHDAIGRVRRLS